MTKSIPKKDDNKKLQALMRHITYVKDACVLIANHLIANDEEEFGRKLIANSLLHDNSKFYGVEWLYLDSEDKQLQKIAIQNHIKRNPHHPEHWEGIGNMPRIYIAEMVADWFARSQEFGSDFKIWIKDIAVDKYQFSLKGNVWKEIKYFTDILLETKF